MSAKPPETERIDERELFFTFARLSLSGFGGVMPWVFREIVEEKRWMSARDFGELLAVGQILPGANVTNFAAMFAYRRSGARGVAAALAGLLIPAFLVILAVGAAYRRFGDVPAGQGALRGVTAVAAGLVLATGYKLAREQPRTVRALVFGLLGFLAIGVLRWPLVSTLAVLIAAALFCERKADA